MKWYRGFWENRNCIQWSEVKLLSRVRLFATPWTVAYQAPLSMGFSRQEYWSGLPFPSPGDLPDPRTEPRSPALLADALTSEPPGKPPVSSEDMYKIDERKQILKDLQEWIGFWQADIGETNREENSKWYKYQFNSVQLLSHFWLFATPWITARQPSLSINQLPEFTQTHVYWVSDAIQPSHPLSSLSLSAFNLSRLSGSFQMSQLFTSGVQSIGVSASVSVLPMNTQDWFP